MKEIAQGLKEVSRLSAGIEAHVEGSQRGAVEGGEGTLGIQSGVAVLQSLMSE